MRNIAILFILLTSFLFFQCQSSSSNAPADNTKAEYEANPSKETADKYLSSLALTIHKEEDQSQRETLLESGLKVASDQNMPNRIVSFLVPLVKDFPQGKNFASHLFGLGNFMHNIKKHDASNILFKSFMTSFPNHESVAMAKSKLTQEIDNIDVYVDTLAARIFQNPNKFGINEKNARSFVDASEAYAMGNPTNPKAAANLFKAAEIAKSLKSYAKSMNLYDWIIDKYPNYEKAPTALFLKGFLIENEMGQIEESRGIYNQFLEKYPDHDLADDVQFLIENLGKSDEEILKMIEAKKK